MRALIDGHDDRLPPLRRRDISDIAGSSVGVRPDVYCWQPEGWAPLAEQYTIVRGGEETSLKGIADDARNRIDLDPGVCAALRFYLRRMRPASLSYENFEMAEALMVVTHQAEHLKVPTASEAEVECYAVQHVRPLIRAAGWDAAYATEMALRRGNCRTSNCRRRSAVPRVAMVARSTAIHGRAPGRSVRGDSCSGAANLPRDAVTVGAPAEAWAESVVVEWHQHRSVGAQLAEQLVDFVRRVTRHEDRHRRREAELVGYRTVEGDERPVRQREPDRLPGAVGPVNR